MNATDTTKQVHSSHAACDHPATKVARAKCRRLRKGGTASTPTDAQRLSALYAAAQLDFNLLPEAKRVAVNERLTAYNEDVQPSCEDVNLTSGGPYELAALALVNAATKGKCSIAKLTDPKITTVLKTLS